MCQFFICLEQGNPGAIACNFVHNTFIQTFSSFWFALPLFLTMQIFSLSFFVHLQEVYETFHPFTRKLLKYFIHLLTFMKLFIYTHESYQLHWIAFMERGAINKQHFPCNSIVSTMAQQLLGTCYPLVASLSINIIQSIATQAKEVFTNDIVGVTLKGMQLIINMQESYQFNNAQR